MHDAHTATVIQEESLTGIVAANHMGVGAVLAVSQTWCCEDKE